MKIMTSPKFLITKLNDCSVLSTASVPSTTAITIMNRATGINTIVMKHIAEMIIARIKLPNLSITRSTLFLKFIGRLLAISLVMSTVTQMAKNPIKGTMK